MNNENNNLNSTVLGNTVIEPNPNPVNPPVTPSFPGIPNMENNPGPVLNPGNTIVEPKPVTENPTVESLNAGNQVLGENEVVGQTPNGGTTIVTPSTPQPSTPNNQGTQNPVSNPNVNGMTPPASPSPAYTNPQTIAQAPMPGFEPSSSVGTTPPISLTKEKQPKKPVNKTVFVILIIGILALIGFGTYYVLNYTNLLKKPVTPTVEVNNLELNLNDPLPTNTQDYATVTGTDINNCTKNLDNVNVNIPGTYQFTVTCGSITKEGTVTVIDNTELVVNTKKVYKSIQDTNIDPQEFLNMSDSEITLEFVDIDEVTNNLKSSGTYLVALKATDKYGKSTEVNETLVVLEHPFKGELTCTSNSQNITDSSAKLVTKNRFMIVDDGNNGYGNVAYEEYTFTYTDEIEYNNLAETFIQENKITINNITGNFYEVKFNDSTLEIVISKEVENSEVVSKYGEENLKNYGSIKAHFQDTLGYTCNYQAVS